MKMAGYIAFQQSDLYPVTDKMLKSMYQSVFQVWVTMPVHTFITLTSAADVAGEEKTFNEYRDYVLDGDTLNNPFIDIYVDTGNITGHEGRHRAIAIENEFGEHTPFRVALQLRGEEKEKYDYTAKDLPPLIWPQFMGNYSIPTKIFTVIHSGWNRDGFILSDYKKLYPVKTRKTNPLKNVSKNIPIERWQTAILKHPKLKNVSVATNPVPEGKLIKQKHATALYEAFRDQPSKHIKTYKIDPNRYDNVQDKSLGKMSAILYTTVRAGKTEHYKHDFSVHSRPSVYEISSRYHIRAVGGYYKFGERGFVDHKIGANTRVPDYSVLCEVGLLDGYEIAGKPVTIPKKNRPILAVTPNGDAIYTLKN